MSRIPSLLIIILLTTVACTGREDGFIVLSDSPSSRTFDPGEFLEYRVASADSLSFYDIDIYARVHYSAEVDKIPLILRIVSPDGKKYADTLRLNISNNPVYPVYSRSGVWRDYRWSYRKGISLPVIGTWYLRVDLIDGSTPVNGLVEFGFILSKR